MVLLFAQCNADLEQWFALAAKTTPSQRGLWLCRPKGTSGVRTDITQASVFEFAHAAAWTDVKICRINKIWTGHMLRRRKKSELP